MDTDEVMNDVSSDENENVVAPAETEEPAAAAAAVAVADSDDAGAGADKADSNIKQEGEENNKKENMDKNDPDFIFCNDDGAPVSSSSRTPYVLYCGRSLGTDLIPGSDGNCGPHDGPQCPSCLRFQYGPMRIQLLQRWFPNIEEDSLCMALRKRGGSISNAAKYLKKLGAKEIAPRHLALPPIPDQKETDASGGEEEANNEPSEDLVSQLVLSLGFSRVRAIAALRRHEGNIELAAAWVLEDPNAVDAAIEEEEEKRNSERRERNERIQARADARKKVMEQKVPQAVAQLGTKCAEVSRQKVDIDADIWIVKGHRMVLQKEQQAESPCCNVCASPVPSISSGSYLCSLCGVCEGCTSSSASVLHKCPALANGGHLHHHPLVYGLDNSHCRCDIENDGCLSLENGRGDDSDDDDDEETDEDDDDDEVKYRPSWSCRQCNFDACAVCMSKEAPNGYIRLLGRVGPTKALAGNVDTAATVENTTQAEEQDRGGGGEIGEESDEMQVIVEDNTDEIQQVAEENEGEAEDQENNAEEVQNDDASSDEGEEDDNDDSEYSESSESDLSAPIGSRPYDAVAGERGAALRWEGSYEDHRTIGENGENGTQERGVVVGTGEIGPRSILTSTLDRQRRGRIVHGATRETGPAGAGTRALLEERGFSEDEAQALALYRARRKRMEASTSEVRQNSSSSLLTIDEANAATDLAHVEDILHRAQGVDDRLTRRALCEAIAAGQLEIAGTLLMSQAFAPLSPRRPSDNEEGDSENNGEEKEEEERKEPELEEVRCWCGDVIDSSTAPTGSVGCLGGHAMHASCAADLLLGGGSCPTCRQPLFYPRVAQSEAKSAAESTRQEILLSRKEEERRIQKEKEDLESKGLSLEPQIGDFVRISPDMKLCEEAQSSDPRSGGWGADMSTSCGMEGRVMEINKDDNGGTVAVRVRTSPRGLGCELTRIRTKENYKCEECDMFGPTYQTGKRKCKHCQRCQTCVEMANGKDSRRNSRSHAGEIISSDSSMCPAKGNGEWNWNPSILEIIGHASAASLWDNSLVDREEAAAKAAERHLFRLRAELRAVMAAREAVRSEMESSLHKEKQLTDMIEIQSSAIEDTCVPSVPKPNQTIGRELSTKSKAAVRHIMSAVSPADWKRARHLLLLARQWGDSPEAKARRAALYEKVKTGDLDSVAREVRRYNALRTAEAAIWADASMETAEYIVESHARIDLRAGPHISAPRTGYVLGPGQIFHSGKEKLDRNGNVWLNVAVEEPLLDIESFVGSNVVYDESNCKASSRAIGASVMRGPDWEWDDQDGGEGKKGIVIKGRKTGDVLVRWNDSPDDEYRYRAGRNGKHDLVFAGAPPLPPQGWLRIRPGGASSPPVVVRARSALRCFSCGDSLVPPQRGGERFLTVGDVGSVRKGDQLFVAATMEPVIVEKSEKGRVLCSFQTTASFDSSSLAETKEDKMNIDGEGDAATLFTEKDAKRQRSGEPFDTFLTWYRSEDLVLPKGQKSAQNTDDESIVVDGKTLTRRELVLLCGGDEGCARNMWNKAKNEKKATAKVGEGTSVVTKTGTEAIEGDEDIMGFASCARGHLMHARCLQGALLAGRCCPAIGCTEPLWVPRVQHERDEDEDTCCGGGDSGASDGAAEAEALRVANELAGHAALVAARREGTAPSLETEEEDVTLAGIRDPRMCPACCAGPLFNNDCSDMQTHHGECSATAIRGSGVEDQCTPDGRFKASASDIAARMMRISATESVADVLPRCPTHKVLVMFNGCLHCGHLFTDTSWDDMPKWDPKAKGLLALDKKKRNAASLLAKQIRKEAAMLQFERDALLDRWENGLMLCGEVSNGSDAKKRKGVLGDLPPPPPPVEKYRVYGCGTDCTNSHAGDGNCLVCGLDWGHHSGHTCGQGMRGSWPLR